MGGIQGKRQKEMGRERERERERERGQYKKYIYFIKFILDLKILQQRISASHQVFERRIAGLYFFGFQTTRGNLKSKTIQVEKLEVFLYFFGFHHFFCKMFNTNLDILQVYLGLYYFGFHENQPKSALKFTNFGEFCRSHRAV